MGSFSIWHWVVALVVVVVIFGTKRFAWPDETSLRSTRHRDLGRMPVYSAETTSGDEAEFIRDRLPNRFPAILLLVLAAIISAVAWWLTR
jgi:hypothetical protein